MTRAGTLDHTAGRSPTAPTITTNSVTPDGVTPNAATDQRLTLTIPEACQMLGIGETTLRQMIRIGQLPILKIGRRVLIPRQALEALVSDACRGSQACPDQRSRR
jgi:excisionase family DNA binding protein